MREAGGTPSAPTCCMIGAGPLPVAADRPAPTRGIALVAQIIGVLDPLPAAEHTREGTVEADREAWPSDGAPEELRTKGMVDVVVDDGQTVPEAGDSNEFPV